jgi:hypothetical protein
MVHVTLYYAGRYLLFDLVELESMTQSATWSVVLGRLDVTVISYIPDTITAPLEPQPFPAHAVTGDSHWVLGDKLMREIYLMLPVQ